jgi:hypothetical protein
MEDFGYVEKLPVTLDSIEKCLKQLEIVIKLVNWLSKRRDNHARVYAIHWLMHVFGEGEW